jgi:hypothetical protein
VFECQLRIEGHRAATGGLDSALAVGQKYVVSKVALSIPKEALEEARKEVAAGRAKSLSSFVSNALAEKLRRDELTVILDAMDAEHGKPNREATRWAKRILTPKR